MRGLIFSTGTPDTIKLVRSFQLMVPDSIMVQYDVSPKSGPNQVNMLAEVRKYEPDVVVYIGAIKEIHHAWVPSTAELCEMNSISPMVHICSDSADPPWWSSLEEYDANQAFRLQVSIDGALDSPIARFERGLVALTPLAPEWFPQTKWSERPVVCGFAGGVGCRIDLVTVLRNNGLLTHFGEGGHSSPYEDLCRFYTICQTVANDARTGSGARRHIKGRFVEAAMAGAVVLEPLDSIAQHWFEPGVDFLQWDTLQHLADHARAAPREAERYQEIGRRLQQKMIAEHSAQVFWGRVFERMGL